MYFFESVAIQQLNRRQEHIFRMKRINCSEEIQKVKRKLIAETIIEIEAAIDEVKQSVRAITNNIVVIVANLLVTYFSIL